MLEKQDAKRSRTARANGLTPSAKPTPGSMSAKPTTNATSSGKATATGKTPADSAFTDSGAKDLRGAPAWRMGEWKTPG